MSSFPPGEVPGEQLEKAHEPVFVGAFVSTPAVETLHVGVLNVESVLRLTAVATHDVIRRIVDRGPIGLAPRNSTEALLTHKPVGMSPGPPLRRIMDEYAYPTSASADNGTLWVCFGCNLVCLVSFHALLYLRSQN